MNKDTPANMVVITPETKPYLEKAKNNPTKEDLQWEPTGIKIKVKERAWFYPVAWALSRFMSTPAKRESFLQHLSPNAEFELKRNKFHRTEFTLGNDFYTRRFKSLFYNYKIGVTKADDENAGDKAKLHKSDSFILYNKAVLAVMPYLTGQKKVPNNPTFEAPIAGSVDIAIANDWPIAPLMTQNLKKNFNNPDLKTIFYLHNTYSNSEYESWFEQVMPLPTWMKSMTSTWFKYFDSGIRAVDAVIGNHNFVETITETNFAKGSPVVNYMKKLLKAGGIYDMHHFLGAEVGPDKSPWLKQDGYVPFKAVDLLNSYVSDPTSKRPSPQLQAAYFEFKKANKVTFQKWTQTWVQKNEVYNGGKVLNALDTNPNAILVGFQNRLDPFQKGFHLIMKIAEDFLIAHPDAQIALPGPGDDVPGIKEWAEEMTKKFPGRFWMPFGRYRGDLDFDDRLHSAGDFFLNPSLYEPYGISHLKSMKMMRPVIGTAVDGLRWSLSDEQPLFQNMTGGPAENYKKYGAIGMLFQWKDMPTYRSLLGKVLGLSEKEQQALQNGTLQYSMADREATLSEQDKANVAENSRRLKDCLERAYQTYKNPSAMATMALNAYKYVTIEHDPHKILAEYYFPSFLNLLSEKPKAERPSLNQLRAEFERFRSVA
jgi:hypothetical protein